MNRLEKYETRRKQHCCHRLHVSITLNDKLHWPCPSPSLLCTLPSRLVPTLSSYLVLPLSYLVLPLSYLVLPVLYFDSPLHVRESNGKKVNRRATMQINTRLLLNTVRTREREREKREREREG